MNEITLEIMPDATAEIAVVVQENRLSGETAASLQTSFAPLFREARSVLEKSRGITVTDASQKLEIKLARECRLELRRIRTTGDKLRKELKDESLRRGRAIDGFQNILLHLTADEEERLDGQEKFVERQEEHRKAGLKASREAALAPYGLDTSFLSLGEMPDETFAQLLENTRAGHEAKLATARKVEEDRIRAENERLKEEARIREENARLQREAKEREAAAKAERERVEKEKAEAAAAASAEIQRRDAMAAEERKKAEASAEEIRRAAAAAAAKAKAEAEAVLRAERELAAKAAREAAAKEKTERDAREKAERELAAQRQVEESRKKAEAEAARKAARAPDREKLTALASRIRALDFPVMASEEARYIATNISRQLEQIAKQIEQEATKL